MQINNFPKLVIIGLYIVGVFVALLLGRIDFVQFTAAVGPFVGYLVGNSIGARQGIASQPVIGPKPEPTRPDPSLSERSPNH